ncbi:MAG: hypothetical protein IJT00_05865, partial [Lachnospiraceae bacterium]|nr:hypothetical protein [Lachnospiraceae bacterium]
GTGASGTTSRTPTGTTTGTGASGTTDTSGTGASGTTSGTGTSGTTSGSGTTNQGKNASDMPRTGVFDQAAPYKKAGSILFAAFGGIELLLSFNRRKRRG